MDWFKMELDVALVEFAFIPCAFHWHKCHLRSNVPPTIWPFNVPATGIAPAHGNAFASMDGVEPHAIYGHLR
jgi:hypothetical protein